MRMPTPDVPVNPTYPNEWFMVICGILAFILVVENIFPGAWGKLWKRGK